MLGGTTDIDLVLVHTKQPDAAREIVKLTPDFHLDIRHRQRNEFAAPRELRADPMLGWELYDPMLLYQREKFFEFIQAGLRAGFEFGAPQLVLTRCRALYASARKAWFELSDLPGDRAGHPDVDLYLSAVNDAANAVAEMNGGPLAERRLLSDFPGRAQAAQRPDLAAALFNLLGASQIDADVLDNWLEPWKIEFLAAAERGGRVDARVHAARLNYYEKAIQHHVCRARRPCRASGRSSTRGHWRPERSLNRMEADGSRLARGLDCWDSRWRAGSPPWIRSWMISRPGWMRWPRPMVSKPPRAI